MQNSGLGKLVSVHGIAPSHLQKAVFIAILSFLFFLAMMFAFYIRQQIGYFLLSTAFLIVYLITMFSIVMQRRRVIEVLERGMLFKGNAVYWDQITAVEDDGTITVLDRPPLKIPRSFHEFERLILLIRNMAGIPSKP